MPNISSYNFETGNVHFSNTEDNRLHVTIQTERLEITSINSSNINLETFHSTLYGNPVVMASCASGVPFSKEKVTTQIEYWDKNWKEHNPFSSFCVNFNAKNNGSFLGSISLEAMSTWPKDCLPEDMTQSNTAEVYYLYQETSWGKGIGNEAAQSIVNSYAPALQEEGYTILVENAVPQPLTYLYATAREDNPNSCRILEKCGLKHEDNQEIYGADRRIYWKKI